MSTIPTSPATLRVALAQTNPVAGAVNTNAHKVATAARHAASAGADLLLTPQMALSGHPARDLLIDAQFVADCTSALGYVAEGLPPGLVAAVGAPAPTGRRSGVADTFAFAQDGQVAGRVAAIAACHPQAGPAWTFHRTVEVNDTLVGLLIGDDAWDGSAVTDVIRQGAQVLLVAASTPYFRGNTARREARLTDLAARTGRSVVFVNAVGGQDEVVFDGGSLAIAPDGMVLLRAPQFETGTFVVDVPVPARTQSGVAVTRLTTPAGNKPALPAPPVTDPLGWEAEMYAALTLAVGDYVRNNGFTQAILGLSGGLDSALVAALAVDALGPDAVRGIGMPGPYSSEHSVADAKALADNLGIRFDLVPITDTYEAEVDLLGDLLDGPGVAVAKENIQSRLRALHLMTLANATNALVLNTGNRSEGAVGYFTLGGDSMGGFAPLQDVPKTVAYALSRWRDTVAEDRGHTAPIPQSTISKPPSAELAPGQEDTDSLPPYPVLDRILDLYLEQGASAEQIADTLATETSTAPDAARETVLRVLAMTDRAEHKRRQVAPGPKVTARAFSADRHMPVTNGRTHHVDTTAEAAA